MTLGRLVLLGSGVLYLLLGLWVLSLRPRPKVNLYLAAYAIAHGLAFVTTNGLQLADRSTALALAAQRPFSVAFGVAAFLLARSVGGVGRGERPRVAAAAAAGLVLGAPWTILASQLFYASLPPLLRPALMLGDLVAFAGVLGAVVLLALQAHPAAGRAPLRDLWQPALLTVAFSVMYAFLSGTGIVVAAHEPARAWAFVLLAASWLLPGALWVRNMIAAGGIGRDVARGHRAVALAIFGLVAAGALWQALFPTDFGFSPMNGIMRTVGILLLVYAIVRHQLLGIDVKVRWGISKSTVAAVFIAVFFVASEAAQQFFGDSLGSTYVGIAAAGALVFAMAPLQRAA
ncbi:MAG TPA: hypothetical protein VM582_04250, partial [Candidatus Thermoplasmatota archaeon]|nr:hypothetical protein [Candidatus Thermoplasmatota archaeon]